MGLKCIFALIQMLHMDSSISKKTTKVLEMQLVNFKNGENVS